MKKIISIFLCTIFYCNCLSQDIPKNLFEKANTAGNVSYLTKNEKEVVLYMNIARIDGSWFVKNILKKEPVGKHSAANMQSLIETLNKTKELYPFLPAEGLSKAARFHAEDMGETGIIGHTSSDGTNTFVRVRKYAKGGTMAENCSYGSSNPIDIVVQLLVDDGVPSLGHRKTIISTRYKYVGIAIEKHKRYGATCVQDFSDTGD